MKIPGLIAALVTASMACGSFELMFVLDADASTKGIHRFDPISGAYFGRFGSNQLTNPVSMALGANGRIHVLDVPFVGSDFGARIRTFDGNTGQFINSFTVQYRASAESKLLAHPDGRFSVSTGTSYGLGYVATYTATGDSGFVNSLAEGTRSGGVGILEGQTILATSNSNTHFVGFFDVGSNIAQPAKFSFSGTGNNTNIATRDNVGVMATSQGAYARFLKFGSNMGMQASGAVPNLTSVSGITMGHGPLVHAIGSGPNGFRISSFDGTNFDNFGVYDYGQLVKNPRDIAMVAAPEPASMTLFGLGLVAILKRRNRSA